MILLLFSPFYFAASLLLNLVNVLSFTVFTFLLNVLDLSALNDIFLTPGNRDKEMGIFSLPLFFFLPSLPNSY